MDDYITLFLRNNSTSVCTSLICSGVYFLSITLIGIPASMRFSKTNKSAGFDFGEHTTDTSFPPVFNKCLYTDLALLPTATKIISNRASVFVKPFSVKSMVL